MQFDGSLIAGRDLGTAAIVVAVGQAAGPIVAAQAVGCSTPRILLTEIAPNVLNHLIVVATLEMAHAILLEAALSFLGLGVQPPTPSWGLMISEAKGLMFFDAWLISIPGIALFLLVLAINLLGDGLRDLFGARTDP